MIILKRREENPILKPNKEQSWEAEAVFNGCPIRKGNKIYLLYRALSLPHYHLAAQIQMRVSDIGIAESRDGVNFSNRQKFIIPEHKWERFGCEDPRVTKLGEKFYIFYTALSAYPFRADGIKVGLAISKDLKNIKEKHLITPFNAKAMALFPEKINPVRNSEGSSHTSSLRDSQHKISNGVNGKMCAILAVNTDRPPSKIALAYFDKEEDMWSEKYWQNWYVNVDQHSIPLQRRTEDHVEIGAPPIKTKYGWLLIYSYIRNYFSSQRLFTIETALLDLRDPSKIIARTNYALLAPEEAYELYGIVPNTIFPSGALLNKDELFVYYGAADTTVALATGKLSSLIKAMFCPAECVGQLSRAKENPIIAPLKNHPWEAKAAFNPGALYEDGKVHILYRAMSEDNTSVFGYAASADGIHIDYRHSEPVYEPRESFEQKLVPGGNSGCEDPRLTKIKDTVYMLYTAFDGKHPPRIALTSISLKNFLAQVWDWTKPVLISPPEFDNKDACVFPEKVKGKYLIFHRFGNNIDITLTPSLDFDGKTWLEEHIWLSPRRGMWDSLKVGIAAPPIKTKEGWVLFYHGVSEEDRYYRVGAVLLDLNNPTKIISRTNEPILSPETPYEKTGQIPNVVFPCGVALIGKKVFVYYGAGDSVVGVAAVELEKLLSELQKFEKFKLNKIIK
ncbi:hypothetical protein COV42_01490 [Candidatus Campbellbacteria bacterium CG11_big_fil_rev_8_21_14_0_20_44_21]|uniref:Glycosidase n=1 Tax=Candidatus Campbellbacteria bacterium CG22_combo_CG10-13_8_21_14_all_43_18 TaxID=1974530 RepID=A0A2H0DWC6_9BACT|nr:MAG: hypothetical protein COW82_01845 [Candidatus Campbellbacteria bacterium CG22_combo_CG10-13_8_21_14_all_43_18]PIR24293.1 MAG: hypothetical protein COV42_01490 [Candidatus Campbellbacteria bacterium CG11_big_fil_rev_8_21_14_0_20_44_21]